MTMNGMPLARSAPESKTCDDVLRVDRARRPRLALEALHELGVFAELGGDDDLDRDHAAGAGVLRLEDGPHAASADPADNLVLLREDLTDLQHPDDNGRQRRFQDCRGAAHTPLHWRSTSPKRADFGACRRRSFVTLCFVAKVFSVKLIKA